eukprot:gene12590-15815_t
MDIVDVDVTVDEGSQDDGVYMETPGLDDFIDLGSQIHVGGRPMRQELKKAHIPGSLSSPGPPIPHVPELLSSEGQKRAQIPGSPCSPGPPSSHVPEPLSSEESKMEQLPGTPISPRGLKRAQMKPPHESQQSGGVWYLRRARHADGNTVPAGVGHAVSGEERSAAVHTGVRHAVSGEERSAAVQAGVRHAVSGEVHVCARHAGVLTLQDGVRHAVSGEELSGAGQLDGGTVPASVRHAGSGEVHVGARHAGALTSLQDARLSVQDGVQPPTQAYRSHGVQSSHGGNAGGSIAGGSIAGGSIAGGSIAGGRIAGGSIAKPGGRWRSVKPVSKVQSSVIARLWKKKEVERQNTNRQPLSRRWWSGGDSVTGSTQAGQTQRY